MRRAEAAVSSSQSSEHKLLLRPHFRSCILNSLLLPNLGTLCPPSGSLPRLAGPGRVLHSPSAPVPSTGTPPSRRVFPGQTRFLSERWEPTEPRHLRRYEEEINRRTAAENEFVLLKKVRGGGRSGLPGAGCGARPELCSQGSELVQKQGREGRELR